MKGQLAVIRFVNTDHEGRPVDPGFGVDEGGGFQPDHGFNPDHPSNALPPGWPGRPVHPIERPPQVWPPAWPPGPTDPNWGIDEGSRPGVPEQPIYLPVGPDNSLPPVAGHLPAPNPPPGTIWPPLPPGLPPGKLAILVFIIGLGYRFVVVEIPVKPEQLPGEGRPQPK
jgi:hypothetical protein